MYFDIVLSQVQLVIQCRAFNNAGSILGHSELAVLERSVSKERFNEANQRLPDWSSCDSDQHEQLRPVPTRKLLPAAPASMYKSSKSQPVH